jgi:hypothetical protein
MFKTIQAGVQGALLDVQRVAGDLLDAQQHAVTMLGTERNGLQDQ